MPARMRLPSRRISYGEYAESTVESEIRDAAMHENLWMAPVDAFFYEYCLVVCAYCSIFSFPMNGLFPALSDEKGESFAAFLSPLAMRVKGGEVNASPYEG